MRRSEGRGKRTVAAAFAVLLLGPLVSAEPSTAAASSSAPASSAPASARVIERVPRRAASAVPPVASERAKFAPVPSASSVSVADAATNASSEAVEEPSASAVLVPLPSEIPPEPAPPPPPVQPPPGALAPSATPSPSASAAAVAGPEVSAKIHDTVVFSLRRPHGDKSTEERARGASEALERAVDTAGAEDVRVERHGETVAVYAGQIPIVELYPEDADAAGYATVETLGGAVGARVRDAITSEKKRSALASTVFSFSLAIFFGLIAFYVLRKVSEFFDRARKWALDDPDRIKGIRFQSQVVVGPAALRGGAYVALILGRWMAQIGVAYLWLVFALSLFQSTRPYTEKLTGFVVTPLSSLAARFAASLPLVVVAAVSGVAVFILLRFAQLFFEGVERKQTELAWLPADLAAPTSVLVRGGILVTALVFAAPIVTGDQEGAVTRTGTVALVALGLASTPLLASIIVGVLVVYGRRLRVGHHAELGGIAGKVLAVGLVDVRLLDGDGCEVRVPHLLSLVHPTRSLGARPRVRVDISVVSVGPPGEVRRLLVEAASDFGEKAVVELLDIARDVARYRVVVSAPPGSTAGDLREALVEALGRSGVLLGRAHGRETEPP